MKEVADTSSLDNIDSGQELVFSESSLLHQSGEDEGDMEEQEEGESQGSQRIFFVGCLSPS